jgi:hypothetical protein
MAAIQAMMPAAKTIQPMRATSEGLVRLSIAGPISKANGGTMSGGVRSARRTAPDDDGWHIESTGANANGDAIGDPASRERVLLLLFLFSDVGPDDAPTRVRLGSHLYAARLLFGTGKPAGFLRAANELVPQTEHLLEVAATGQAGDVWLCHPFVVHAGQRHRGERVKFMGQPPLAGTCPIDPIRLTADRSPVEEAVYRALSFL